MRKPDALVNPADQRSGGNCGVTAVSIAAGISFQQAWDLFVKHCPRIKRNKKWSGGTYDYEREIIMEKLKIKYQSHSPLQILHMLPSKSPCNFTLEYFTRMGSSSWAIIHYHYNPACSDTSGWMGYRSEWSCKNR